MITNIYYYNEKHDFIISHATLKDYALRGEDTLVFGRFDMKTKEVVRTPYLLKEIPFHEDFKVLVDNNISLNNLENIYNIVLRTFDRTLITCVRKELDNKIKIDMLKERGVK